MAIVIQSQIRRVIQPEHILLVLDWLKWNVILFIMTVRFDVEKLKWNNK